MADNSKYIINIQRKKVILEERSEAKLVFEGGITGAPGVATGKLRFIPDLAKIKKLRRGDILLTKEVQPGWGQILKLPVGIITSHGGPTSHIGVLSRDMDIPCIVGADDAIGKLKKLDNQFVTIDASEKKIYKGKLPLNIVNQKIDIRELKPTKTKIGLMFAHPRPEKYFAPLSNYASYGGNNLLRTEFALLLEIGIHPRALVDHFHGILQDKELTSKINKLIKGYNNAKEFYIDIMAKSIGECTSIFPEHETVIRTLDTKTNEYRDLLGGENYEKEEINPMMGWRGALRFISPANRQVSIWELEVMKRLMKMGHNHLSLTIPVCRDPIELLGGEELRQKMKKAGRKDWQEWKGIYEIMEEVGIRPHTDIKVGIEIETPSNVIRSDEFAAVLDFSTFGPNDLTQFCLACDRENAEINKIYSSDNPAILEAIRKVTRSFKRAGKTINIVGQNFSQILLETLLQEGIDSIGTSWEGYFDLVEKIAELEKHIK